MPIPDAPPVSFSMPLPAGTINCLRYAKNFHIIWPDAFPSVVFNIEHQSMNFELAKLLPNAILGDEAAMSMIVQEFSNLIERECSKFDLWQHPDWSHSDLVQEVIFRVWTKLDQFQGMSTENPRAAFEQWIRKTARNVILNLSKHLTRKKRSPDHGLKEFDEATQAYTRVSDPTASSIVGREEEIDRVQEAIRSHLTDQKQLILNLRLVEGLSLQEISERLSLGYDQVRYQFQTSLTEIENRLGNNSGE